MGRSLWLATALVGTSAFQDLATFRSFGRDVFIFLGLCKIEGDRQRRASAHQGSRTCGANADRLLWLKAAKPLRAAVTSEGEADNCQFGIKVATPAALFGEARGRDEIQPNARLGGDCALTAGDWDACEGALGEILGEFGVPCPSCFAHCALGGHSFLDRSASVITLVRLHWSPLR